MQYLDLDMLQELMLKSLSSEESTVELLLDLFKCVILETLKRDEKTLDAEDVKEENWKSE